MRNNNPISAKIRHKEGFRPSSVAVKAIVLWLGRFMLVATFSPGPFFMNLSALKLTFRGWFSFKPNMRHEEVKKPDQSFGALKAQILTASYSVLEDTPSSALITSTISSCGRSCRMIAPKRSHGIKGSIG